MKAFLASALLLAPSALAQDVLFSGNGFGTYYYDVFDMDGCATGYQGMEKQPVECSLEEFLALETINSDYLVAMNHTQLAADMGKWCGKRVIVSVNGVPSSMPFFIGDGCGRCSEGSADQATWDPAGAPGLDFSFAALNQLNSEACAKGHIDISWEIVDEQIYNFATTGTTLTNGWATSPPLTQPIAPTSTVASTTAVTTTAVTTSLVTTTTATTTASPTTTGTSGGTVPRWGQVSQFLRASRFVSCLT